MSTVSSGKLVGGSAHGETCVLEQGTGECNDGEVGWASGRPAVPRGGGSDATADPLEKDAWDSWEFLGDWVLR